MAGLGEGRSGGLAADDCLAAKTRRTATTTTGKEAAAMGDALLFLLVAPIALFLFFSLYLIGSSDSSREHVSRTIRSAITSISLRGRSLSLCEDERKRKGTAGGTRGKK